LVADSALDFVGVSKSSPSTTCGETELPLSRKWPSRNPCKGSCHAANISAYKNQFGRIGIVAGSRGFTARRSCAR
jgi:hypothetical protein